MHGERINDRYSIELDRTELNALCTGSLVSGEVPCNYTSTQFSGEPKQELVRILYRQDLEDEAHRTRERVEIRPSVATMRRLLSRGETSFTVAMGNVPTHFELMT